MTAGSGRLKGVGSKVTMWRTRAIAAAVILALGGGVYLAWRLTHRPLSDKEQILRLFEQVEQGVEKKSPRLILAAIADDYRDAYGYTKLDIHRLSLSLLRTEGTIDVVLTQPRIEIYGTEADASIRGEAILTQGEDESVEYSGALTVHLRKRGQWRIVSTTGWQEEAAAGFE